jgi:hypothetical protein
LFRVNIQKFGNPFSVLKPQPEPQVPIGVSARVPHSAQEP